MSLVKCSKCKKEYANYMVSCPNCIVKEKKLYDFEHSLGTTTFKKLEKALRKYNMLAYKKLALEYYNQLQNGKFIGEIISSKDSRTSYELKLPTDETFAKVHGEITLQYTVFDGINTIFLDTITPTELLLEGATKELMTYKGVVISRSHQDLDIMKINILNSLKH